jgi:hypothetical protein
MSDEYLKSLKLTPQELNKVAYHRANLVNPGRDSEGNAITIYSTGIQVPSGKYKGQFVSVPGFVNGKVVTDENALWKIWKNDISAGKWPVYKSSNELNARDQYVHQVMDRDVMDRMKVTTQEPSSLIYKDPFEEPDY